MEKENVGEKNRIYLFGGTRQCYVCVCACLPVLPVYHLSRSIPILKRAKRDGVSYYVGIKKFD